MNDFNSLIKSTQFTVQEASFATVGDFWKDMVFFYKHNRIYYVTNGDAELVLKGTKLHLISGHLYFIPAYSVVTAECKVFLSHYYVHFELDSMLNNIFDSMQFEHDIKASTEDEILFRSIVDNIGTVPPTPFSLLTMNGALQIIMAKFLRNAKVIRSDVLRFSNVLSYVEEHVTEKITVSDLANLSGLNEVYFSNLFSKTMGVSPLQFILNKKINHSMTLLRNKGMTVKETAFRLGFNDELYFSRLFKQKTGVSPTEFKNSGRAFE